MRKRKILQPTDNRSTINSHLTVLEDKGFMVLVISRMVIFIVAVATRHRRDTCVFFFFWWNVKFNFYCPATNEFWRASQMINILVCANRINYRRSEVRLIGKLTFAPNEQTNERQCPSIIAQIRWGQFLSIAFQQWTSMSLHSHHTNAYPLSECRVAFAFAALERRIAP